MIGQMRHRITLQDKTRIPTPGGGGISDWSDLATVWSDAQPVSSRFVNQDNQETFLSGYKFRIRYTVAFTPEKDMRILYDGQFFKVDGVIDIKERQRFWDITAFTNSYPVS